MILDVTLKLPNGTELKLTVAEWRALQVQLNSLFPNVISSIPPVVSKPMTGLGADSHPKYGD
jgi:hypothetical protein